MRIVLDRGHGQKAPGAPFDPGACAGGLREVDLAAGYIRVAAGEIRAAGHEVLLLDSGTYDDRHARALAWAAEAPHKNALYVQCHVNAGGGKYGVVEHDARSSWGRTAAACLADALDELPETRLVRVWPISSAARGWSCIDDIYASPTMAGLIFEPGFIDSAGHQALWTAAGLAQVGRTLAEGIRRYASVCAARKAA